MAVMKKIFDITVTDRQYSELMRLLNRKRKDQFWERLSDITEIDPKWLRTHMEFCSTRATRAKAGDDPVWIWSDAAYGIQGMILFHGPVPNKDSGQFQERDVSLG